LFLSIFRKTGENGPEIWLSIVGKVYDVTSGRDFYGPGSGYAAFAGTDASVAYVTGKFTAEEAAKGLDSISSIQVAAINDWAGFYDKSVKYNFVGLLVDPRFYDEEGKPNQPLIEHQKVAEERQEKDRLWKEKQKQKTPAKKAPAKKTS
jgi:predicted heme/steroid binding protein